MRAMICLMVMGLVAVIFPFGVASAAPVETVMAPKITDPSAVDAAPVVAQAVAAPATSVYTEAASFIADTSATQVPLPADAETALPDQPFDAQFIDYSCTGDGVSLAEGTVTVNNPDSDWLCLFGPNWNAGLANTNPTPVAPTLSNNGEDDFTLAFEPSIHAVGLELLTNAANAQQVTVHFADGTSETITEQDLGTGPNGFHFVGFAATTAIVGLDVDTTDGALQNVGISQIWTAAVESSPDCEYNLAIIEGCETAPVCCLLYTSPSPRDATLSRMPSSA